MIDDKYIFGICALIALVVSIIAVLVYFNAVKGQETNKAAITVCLQTGHTADDCTQLAEVLTGNYLRK